MHVAVEGQCVWHHAVKRRVLLIVYRSNVRDHRNAFPQSITMHSGHIIVFLYMLSNIVYAC